MIALAARYILGFSWIEAGLVGAAIAPTDPAVTFSIFAGREIRGRSGTILQGEAGMNDPVGIALMIGMIELAQEDDGSLWIVAREFAVEMVIGLAVGIAGALLVLPVLRRVRMTGPALYPIRVLAVAGVVYGLAAVAGGSGFLAVFVAGVVLGDAAMLRKGEIESFQSSVAVLAEIAVFIALGLTISEADLGLDTWIDGLAIAVILAFVARPLAVVPLLLPERLTSGERLFIAWGGLKGAVPILLGALAVLAGVDGASSLYGIVFVVVLFSVIVQGSSVPYVARRLRIPFRRVDHDLAEVRRVRRRSAVVRKRHAHPRSPARGASMARCPAPRRPAAGNRRQGRARIRRSRARLRAAGGRGRARAHLHGDENARLGEPTGPDVASGPGIGRARDRMEVAGREALEAERIEEARMVAEKCRGDLASDADHLVAVVRVEDSVDVGPHVIEDREVVGRKRADSPGAGHLVLRSAALEAAHRVRERGAPHVREGRIDVRCRRVRVELDVALDGQR